MSSPRTPKPWERYEEVAAELLNHLAEEFGVDRFEGNQILPGTSGADWEIDAKGVADGAKRVVVVECRRTKARQSQARLAALAFTLADTGAEAGIIVSPLPLQAGAAKVAAASKIHHVQLDANSTPQQFAMKFLNKLFLGVSVAATARAEASPDLLRLCSACGERFVVLKNEKLCPSCAIT